MQASIKTYSSKLSSYRNTFLCYILEKLKWSSIFLNTKMENKQYLKKLEFRQF